MFTVKQARLLRELSQNIVAEKMGIDVGTYRRIEKNPEKSSVENAIKFCEIVNMSINDIFFG